MSYLEELLPEFRKGAKIRLPLWDKGKFIILKEDAIVDNANYEYPLSIHETLSNQWELYQEPEPDWDSIINNKCLCWFWDSNEEVIGSAGMLKEVKSREEYPFIKIFNNIEFAYQHCRPVRRDEVTFYEDRKDG